MKKLIAIVLLSIVLMTGCSGGGNKGLATMQHFEEIQIGMTYEEVCEIIGSEGELVAEAGSDDLILQSYSWEGSKSGSSISISILNGIVDAKGQVGLE